MANRFDLVNLSNILQTSANGTVANVNFDSNTLFIDGVNNRVGIGTSSPITQLAVVGGAMQFSPGTSAEEGVRIQRAAGVCTFSGINNDNNTYNGLAFFTGASEAMRIDTSGRVTMSAQPAFHATSTNSPSTNQEWVFNGTAFNKGNHFNTTSGRFTAPVAGVYFFYVYGLPANGDNSDIRISLRVNGTVYSSARFIITKNFNSWQTTYGHVIMSLNANDFVSPYVDQAGGGFHTDNGFTGFGGCLLS